VEKGEKKEEEEKKKKKVEEEKGKKKKVEEEKGKNKNNNKAMIRNLFSLKPLGDHFITCWMTKGSEFESEFELGQEFSLQHVIHISFGAHLASYPLGMAGSFPGGKVAKT
jgi:hypothetical protein